MEKHQYKSAPIAVASNPEPPPSVVCCHPTFTRQDLVNWLKSSKAGSAIVVNLRVGCFCRKAAPGTPATPDGRTTLPTGPGTTLLLAPASCCPHCRHHCCCHQAAPETAAAAAAEGRAGAGALAPGRCPQEADGCCCRLVGCSLTGA